MKPLIFSGKFTSHKSLEQPVNCIKHYKTEMYARQSDNSEYSRWFTANVRGGNSIQFETY